ncbi:putative glycosyltransferase (exosortase G-associated) [Clostridium acetobutylicum]|uniref:TIGR03111 family XrtG-associated glycosyltransferase n=1 Tax=Clostridium TaxID=1485 RepID=UPI000200C13A|nr:MULTISPECIES: TIGR03111 family XrtG-associated glycosyltransferase [Clostridium]ADZ21573.1 Glycosyltransferase [Clostridium acetobutylicum EA 2018]AEI33923.1 glycosyltransferase [Clostridium acetobutylicum DSM 1731]AWV79108.1 putative glycosyltransferase, exosortase G system-associated [Clostridium acetobutylicum]MBC2394931.1 putative glycosyltransferase, exosortase G system-associated [Clostridium acetobutylicum]MBC2585225.1 putative glycosyltransferase, exosortase G system-associated [Clo
MKQQLIRQLLFWGIWLVIPLIVDIIGGVIGAIFITVSYFRKKKLDIGYLPDITILIPIYNSENTLENCLNSVINQTYPIEKISVMLINNGKRDKAYNVFCSFQERNPRLKVWWLDSSSGKAKALNKGIYMANGKYIINIDSDGVLDKEAILKVVEKFETNPDICAMTGVVLTDPELIEETKLKNLRLIQRCELFEYIEAFLIGRGFQSQVNMMFTLAGAFSCYRREIIMKTQLYNNETLGEDTHMTSQIRELLDGKIALCEEAFFYVDPIDDLDKLYIQRQRWQRGQMEVSALFNEIANKNTKRFINVLKVTIIKDHSLVFPRFIWIFAMMYLVFLDYPLTLVVGANLILYIVYVITSTIYFFIAKLFLKEKKQIKDYVNKHWYIILLLPIYRFVVFFIRVAGIINAVEKNASWNTKTFSQEREIVDVRLKKNLSLYYRIKGWINNG